MMQVYDRVLHSHNEATLFMLTILAVASSSSVAAFEFSGRASWCRTGGRFDKSIGRPVFWPLVPRQPAPPDGGIRQGMRDLDTVREFLTGGGIIAFCDAPWMPIFLARLLHASNAGFGVVARTAPSCLRPGASPTTLMTREHPQAAPARLRRRWPVRSTARCATPRSSMRWA